MECGPEGRAVGEERQQETTFSNVGDEDRGKTVQGMQADATRGEAAVTSTAALGAPGSSPASGRSDAELELGAPRTACPPSTPKRTPAKILLSLTRFAGCSTGVYASDPEFRRRANRANLWILR